MIEADAVSAFSSRDSELNRAGKVVTTLREHLSHAQNIAQEEADLNRVVVQQVGAELDAQRKTSLQQEADLRDSLEQRAQAIHDRIVKEREDAIKSEAEARHSESMRLACLKVESQEA